MNTSEALFWYPVVNHQELLLLHNQLVFQIGSKEVFHRYAITLSVQTSELLNLITKKKLKYLLNPMSPYVSTTEFTCNTNLIVCSKQFTNNWELQLHCDLSTMRSILILLAKPSPINLVLDSIHYLKLKDHLASKLHPASRLLEFNLRLMSKSLLKVPEIALDLVFYGLLQLRLMATSELVLLPLPDWELPLVSTSEIRQFVTLPCHNEKEPVAIPSSTSSIATRKLQLLKHEVSYLIGVNGQRISQIRSLTRCIIKIDTVDKSTLSLLNMVKARNLTQTIELIGPQSQILHATSIINNYLTEYRNNCNKFS